MTAPETAASLVDKFGLGCCDLGAGWSGVGVGVGTALVVRPEPLVDPLAPSPDPLAPLPMPSGFDGLAPASRLRAICSPVPPG